MTSASSYRDQPPSNLTTSPVDADYDYRATGKNMPTPTPTSASARGWQEVENYKQAEMKNSKNNDTNDNDNQNNDDDDAADGEEALLDLVQLEELHQEAERMKALGNKHMAAQGM